MQICMDTNELEFYNDEGCVYDESDAIDGDCEDDVV